MRRLYILFAVFAVSSFCGVCKSAPSSIEKLLIKAKSGDANSQFTLARRYSIGQGVPQDYNESFKWYTKAAEQGNAKAQYELGAIYDDGRNVVQDYGQAIQWYTKAAAQGNANAQHSLGLIYGKGRGVRRDYNQAVEWFKKAAAQGLTDAQFDLGLMYFRGQGVEKDYSQAVQLFTKAAERGNTKAQYILGMIYCNDKNEEIPQDYKQAAKWFTKAAVQGQAKAQYVLGMMYCSGEGVEQNYTVAAKWFTKAAAQGNAESQLTLGVMYWNGKGVLENYVEGYKWLLLAAMNGDKDAQWLKKDLREKMTPGQIEEAQQKVNRVKKIKGFLAEKENNNKDNNQTAENIESMSTGFLITSDGFVLTACHSVGKAENVEVTYNQKKYTAKVIGRDESIDAAVLKIDGNDFSFLPIASSDAVKTGDAVFTMGYPQITLQGTEPKFTEGSISSLSGLTDNPQYFQISVPIQPGNSGGPLVNKNGEVIGLIVAKLNDVSSLLKTGSVPQNVNYALKSSFILSFFESVPDLSQKIKITVDDSPKDRSATIEKTNKSVVLIVTHK